MAGHEVLVLESAREIGEVGAGIQCLSNSSRTLLSWGLHNVLSKKASPIQSFNILGWKGNPISDVDFQQAADEYASPCWNFHRADLHKALLDRAVGLGAKLVVDSEVTNIRFDELRSRAVVSVRDQQDREADLVIGADGINSRCREILLGRPEAPTRTGDMAYRVMLHAKDIEQDPELRPILHGQTVNLWWGPGAHAGKHSLPPPAGELLDAN